MRSLHSLLSVLLLALAVAACSSDPGDGGDTPDASDNGADADPNAPDADPNAPDAMPGTDAAPPPLPPGFVSLVERDWTLQPGTEVYRCTRVTVQEDMYVNTFRSLSPLGTHHTVLSVEKNSSEPDGDYDCGAGSISHAMLFASGVGTDDLELPEGVAIRLEAGDQLDLNLHLYNVSDSAISGTSGTLARLIPAGDVTDQAEVVFGGTYAVWLPSNPGVMQSINGGCQFEQDATVVALWPHMHALGRHMRVTLGGQTIMDSPFDFNEQLNEIIDPLQVSAGQNLQVECIYENNTGSLVTFGDSSDQEMCFVGIYRYPATGAGVFDCVDLF